MSPDVLLEGPRTSFRYVLRVNVTERVWHSPGGGVGGLQQRSTPACESSQGCIEKRCKENIHLAQRYIIPQTKLSSLDESLGLLDCIGIFPPLEPLAYAQCDIKGREGFHFDFG